jgi:hypothetical protein
MIDEKELARVLCRANGHCVGFCHAVRCNAAAEAFGHQARAARAAFKGGE